jgi:heme/copper-type cytochrome/quinol oxidase subunit 2
VLTNLCNPGVALIATGPAATIQQGIASVRNEIAQAVAAAGAKSAPPVAVVAASVTGALDMTFLVGAATFVYVVAQLAYLVWKWRREANKP